MAQQGQSRVPAWSSNEDRSILIDYGLFQGPRTLETLNREPFSFDAARSLQLSLLTPISTTAACCPSLSPKASRPVYATTQTPRRLLRSTCCPMPGASRESEAERRNHRRTGRTRSRSSRSIPRPVFKAAYDQIETVAMRNGFGPRGTTASCGTRPHPRIASSRCKWAKRACSSQAILGRMPTFTGRDHQGLIM